MIRTLIALLLAALPLSAAHIPYSLSPASGPKSGGTTVILRGTFSNASQDVLFGGVRSPSVTRLDEHTVSAVAPAHFGDAVEVEIFERAVRLPAELTYTYRGDAPFEQFERLLLPIFLPPIQGAFGSEFRTYLRLSGVEMELFGLLPGSTPYPIGPFPTSAPAPNGGTPGRFIYAPKDGVKTLAATLRVADTSRSAENFGTELPIVRASDFVEDVLVLHGVPTDPRFRNTLRIYARDEGLLSIHIESESVSRQVQLRKNDLNDPFEPAYAVFTDFPVGRGELRVTLEGPSARGPSPPIYYLPFWGFVSVTNNETQHITTITRQP
ncbi:MAG TPA: IPT/TIG domain-containing protein [Thermoanaerobaculia bacterium]